MKKTHLFIALLLVFISTLFYFLQIIPSNIPTIDSNTKENMTCETFNTKLVRSCFGKNTKILSEDYEPDHSSIYSQLPDLISRRLLCSFGSDETEGEMSLEVNTYDSLEDATAIYKLRKDYSSPISLEEEGIGDAAFSSGFKTIVLENNSVVVLSQSIGSSNCINDLPASIWNDILKDFLKVIT